MLPLISEEAIVAYTHDVARENVVASEVYLEMVASNPALACVVVRLFDGNVFNIGKAMLLLDLIGRQIADLLSSTFGGE